MLTGLLHKFRAAGGVADEVCGRDRAKKKGRGGSRIGALAYASSAAQRTIVKVPKGKNAVVAYLKYILTCKPPPTPHDVSDYCAVTSS